MGGGRLRWEVNKLMVEELIINIKVGFFSSDESSDPVGPIKGLQWV